MKSIFIFRRDFRIEDNTGLIKALEQSEVIPIFIFTPEQVINNEYKNDNSIQFMINSLKDLDKSLKSKNGKLHLFEGKNEEIISYLIDKYEIDILFSNKDYTPYAIARDKSLELLCNEKNIEFKQFEDYLLTPIDAVLNKKNPYKVFTPYYNEALKVEIEKPIENIYTNYIKLNDDKEITFQDTEKYYTTNENILIKGGREEALKIMDSLKEKLINYEESRNYPSTDTSLLSAHIKFGTVSSKEIYHQFVKISPKFIRQLFWRDFWVYTTYNHPKVLSQNYNSKFDKINWINNNENFNKWKKGETGVPIIDAGMRQLNKTGSMHNRIRMLTASFLTKNLLIDWKLGAKYFAQKLIDYCPMQNQNNWQSVLGSGISASAWYRVKDFWTQQREFDNETNYIKKWIPELKDVPKEDIHTWSTKYEQYKKINYPRAMKYNTKFDISEIFISN